MDFYLNRNDRQLVVSPVSTATLPEQTFYENDLSEIRLQVLDRSGQGATTPFVPVSYTSTNTTMSIAAGIPGAISSTIIGSSSLGWDSSNTLWTGSLSFAGSTLQNILIGGSSSYLEIQESSPTYRTTHLQTTVNILPSII